MLFSTYAANNEIIFGRNLVVTEAADHSGTPAAGKGLLWVKSTTPSTLIYTDDAGTDFTLGSVSNNASDLVWTGGTQSEVADGASAIAFEFDTDNDLSTSGAKLLSLKNNGTERFSIDKRGQTITIGGSGGSGTTLIDAKWSTFTIDVSDLQILTANTSTITIAGNATHSQTIRIGHRSANATISHSSPIGDTATYAFTLNAQAAYSGATSNLVGGAFNINAGAGASSSAGDADGGAVNITGGGGYGTGDGGSLNLNGGAANGSGASGSINIAPTQGLVGFFAATAVAQQSGTGETTGFTAGSGTGVNDDSTFTGNVGSTAYRINDIVKALKNYGLLAS